MINIAAFYAECQRASRFPAEDYTGYGKIRQRDCDYAEKIMGFQWMDLPTTWRLSGWSGDKLAQFSQILNKPGASLDGRYIIAPDTRVPNYTERLEDTLELAQAIGMTTLTVPVGSNRSKQIIAEILAACDAWLESRSNADHPPKV